MKEKNARFRIWCIAAFGVLNVVAGIYLAGHFYEIRDGGIGFHSACNLGAFFDCDQVAASSYAELGMGLPLAGFVAGWYLAVSLLALLALFSSWRKTAVASIAVMTAVSCAFSVAYTSIMVFALHSLCLFCLGISVVDFLSLFLALSFRPWAAARESFAGMDVLKAKQSAPTFFANGHRMEGAYPMAVWERIVPALLK